MDTSDITRSYIIETARKYGFQRDTLEKVIRLYQILKDMSGIPLFRDCFALKGGTAINLVCFNLPRLSVDIDLDFTRFGRMPELLPLRKEIKSALFDLLQSRAILSASWERNFILWTSGHSITGVSPVIMTT